jgi:phosphoglycolate phosphatase-like HAD superfamily hydrolase
MTLRLSSQLRRSDVAIVSPPVKKTLILWDIDGTLLHSGGAGMRALTAALRTVCGIDGSLADVDFAGRTDPWIVRQVLRKFGLDDSPEAIARYLDGYLTALPTHMAAAGARVLPGARRLLDEAALRPEVAQALLTGNVRRGAETKLGYHGLWHYFPLGAFADDSEVRNELGPHALRRAHAHWGVEFSPARVWIVGDTPHDIACARAIGARVLAVASGASSTADLARHAPDALMESLDDAAAFWRHIG